MSADVIPGPRGLVPTSRDAAVAIIRENKKRRKRERREAQQLHALTRAYWWGFNSNRRQRRANQSPKMAGPFSRGVFIDAYGDVIDRTNPADMEFAVGYIHPCKSSITPVFVMDGVVNVGTRKA